MNFVRSRCDGERDAKPYARNAISLRVRNELLAAAMTALLCIRVRNGVLIVETAADDVRTTKSITLEYEAGWWQAAIGSLDQRSCAARSGQSCSEVVRWQLSYVTDGFHGRRRWV